MSSKNKSQLRTENSNNFPNNNSQFITPEKLRDFNNDIIDSMVVNQDTGSYLVTSSFDTGSRQQTFTRLDGTTYTNLIPGGGSSETGSLLVTASVVDADITFTKGDGTTFDILVNNVSSSISASHAEFADETDDVILNVKNTSGADIGKGLAVHATGVTGENVNIKLADSSVSGDMPAIGITRDAISNNASGVVIISGKVKGLDTSTDGLVAGASVYVNGAGVLTATKPTGSDLIQNIGICGKVNASEGEIIVMGSGRSNDLPNITDGYGWFGNTNGVPTAQTTASFAKTDIDNTFSGTQNFDNISVSGTGSFGRINTVTGSAKIIGDAFVVVNADTPTLRYAGLQVYDSGSSNATASIQWDGLNDSWILVEEGGESSFILTGPTGSLGSEANLSNNSLPKGAVHRQLVDSNISDNGTTITLGSTTDVSGPLSASNLESIEITNLQNSGSEDRTRIDGLSAETGSYAVTNATNTFTEKQLISGSNGFLEQSFDAPGTNQEKALFNVIGADINGQAYNRVFYGMADYPSFGNNYKDYFALEYYDSIGYNFGSEFSLNGVGSRILTAPSGVSTSNMARFQTNDDGDGTSTAQIRGNSIRIGADSATNTQLVIGNGGMSTSMTGTNNFFGRTVISSSLELRTDPVTISSNTASLDFSAASMFELTLVSGSTTHIIPTNVAQGQTVNLLIEQPGTGTGSIEFCPEIFQPTGSLYTPTARSGTRDILTMISFNNTSQIFVSNVKELENTY